LAKNQTRKSTCKTHARTTSDFHPKTRSGKLRIAKNYERFFMTQVSGQKYMQKWDTAELKDYIAA